jgi:hypothetical protein
MYLLLFVSIALGGSKQAVSFDLLVIMMETEALRQFFASDAYPTYESARFSDGKMSSAIFVPVE